MCLEYLGLPCDPAIIERRIHPYGAVDVGELPAELARFARRLGFVAQHYNRGTVQQLEYHLQQGHVVILMLNYKNGGGHLVNLLGFDTEGDQITGFRIRNPWGFDESIPTKRFLNEWRHMRQSRNSIVGSLLPVFDAGFAVLASSGTLPTMTFLDWLHSAPVDLLVSSMNGIGGSASTMCNHHWLPALGQLFGNCIGTLGGLAAYTIGNLVGLNLVFVGDRFLATEKSSVVGHVLSVLGSSFSVSGGLVAAGVQLIRKPLIIAGEMLAGRDALCETICDTNLPRLHSALARAEAEQISRQAWLTWESFWFACFAVYPRYLPAAPRKPTTENPAEFPAEGTNPTEYPAEFPAEGRMQRIPPSIPQRSPQQIPPSILGEFSERPARDAPQQSVPPIIPGLPYLLL